ncbi:MAG: hypothetical protein JXJ22_02950 [Bacteroidales bacterium]|nr:hypothetical protein [Bacteroidales bacterium]
MKNEKRNFKTTAVLTGALVTGAITSLSANVTTSELLNYQNLGSGAELRTELLKINSSSLDATRAVNAVKTIKFSELKCGEGKCGSDKKEKKAESKSDTTAVKSKAAESKCGEGKCGEDKKKEKSEGDSKKDKTSESTCGGSK